LATTPIPVSQMG